VKLKWDRSPAMARGVARGACVALMVLGTQSCGLGPATGRAIPDPFGSGRTRPAAESERGSPNTLTVHVSNRNFMDATVEVIEPGRRRLGRVDGNGQREFSIPSFGSRMRFSVEFLGGGSCTTWYVDVAAGETVDLIIDSQPRPRPPNGTRSLCEAVRRRR
jgi:hypothetical protein